ncbi:hypothetical protein TRFO_15366 [Tritrichomonas foetus]|uniref:Uncharacterized protein n=1 Tax=Tritrichomonas foetus TaxID=1144522 RepID=A0A1J4KXN1_9EUKA|nr:hypothetical protein TRFO_15366 [Tritrichomonas foetus]|eukprot:OHT14317.1 hypothetical protein TRFO_15366 [Tritrichomonas foetus]
MEDDEIVFQNFTHFFIGVTSARRLYRFTTRSLFLKFKIHPSVESFISHTIWCQKSDVSFNSAFSIDLSKLGPSITYQDLKIIIELHTKQLQTSKLIGIVNVSLGSFDILEINSNPIFIFYNKEKLPISDPNGNGNIGKIEVIAALGFNNQMSSICSPLRFQNAKITFKKHPIQFTKNKDENKNEDKIGYKNEGKIEYKDEDKGEYKDEDKIEYKDSPKEMLNTNEWIQNNWLPIDSVIKNWKAYAKSNGWTKPKKSKETIFTFHHIEIITISSDFPIFSYGNLLTPSSSVSSFVTLSSFVRDNEKYLLNDYFFPQTSSKKKFSFSNNLIADRNPTQKPKFTLVDHSSLFNTYLNHQYDYDFLFDSESDIDKNIDMYLKENSPSQLKTISKYKSAPTTPVRKNKVTKFKHINRKIPKRPDLSMNKKKKKKEKEELIKLSPSLENILNGKHDPTLLFNISDIDLEEEEEDIKDNDNFQCNFHLFLLDEDDD